MNVLNWIRQLLAKNRFNRILKELRGVQDNIRPSDVVVFSEPLRSTLNNAIRLGLISLTELAEQLQLDRDQAREVAEVLVARRLFATSPRTSEAETYYETRPSASTRPMKRPPIDLWKKIDK